MLAGTATGAGSLIGMLVGVLGGPVGLLLGWGTGALICGAIDVHRAEQIDDAIGEFSKTVPPGSIAVVADVAEPAVEVISGEMRKLDGEVTRRPVMGVLAELEAAEAAAEAAEREARRVARGRKAERQEYDARLAELRQKLGLEDE